MKKHLRCRKVMAYGMVFRQRKWQLKKLLALTLSCLIVAHYSGLHIILEIRGWQFRFDSRITADVCLCCKWKSIESFSKDPLNEAAVSMPTVIKSSSAGPFESLGAVMLCQMK